MKLWSNLEIKKKIFVNRISVDANLKLYNIA